MLWLLVSSLVKSFLTPFFALCSLLHFSWLLVLSPNSFFTPLFTSYRFSSFTFLVSLFSPIPSSSSISSSSTFCFPSSPFFYCALFSFPLFSFFLTPTSPLFATFSFLLVPCSTFPASPLLRKCPHLLSSSSSLPLRFVSSSPSVHFPHYLFTYPISSLHFLLLLFLNPSISSICPHLLSSASSPCFRFFPLLLHNNRRRWLKHLCHQCRLMF